MKLYRLYFIGSDGHFDGVHEIEVASDERAIEVAAQYANQRPAELWERDRRIKIFPTPPKGGQPPSPRLAQ